MEDRIKHLNIKIIESEWYKRPFRTYTRIGGGVFGVVLLGNLASTLYLDHKRTKAQTHPDLFALGLLGKSIWYGVVWPSFVITSLTSPRNVFIFGESFEKLRVDYNNFINSEEQSSSDKHVKK